MNAKKRFINAMDKLLKEYEIEHISMDMILQEADLSKSTFYRYFYNKYALITEYYHYHVDNYLSKQGTNFQETMIGLLVFIKENKKYFLKLTNLQKPDDFFHVFYESSYRNTIIKINHNHQTQLNKKEEDALSLFISGCAYICEQWIIKGMKEDPQYISQLLFDSIPLSLKDYFQ